MNGEQKALRRRLSGVEQTRQITNAMNLISTARFRQTAAGMEYTLKYLDNLRKTMLDVLAVTKGAGIRNRFTEKDTKGTSLYLCIMGDKGLCGGYNNAVASLAAEKLAATGDALVYCFGEVGDEILRSRGVTPARVLPGSSMHPEPRLARSIADTMIGMYLTDEVNQVYIIYTPYSPGERAPACFRLLPLLRHDFKDLNRRYAPSEMLYAPDLETVFARIVPLYCSGVLYDFLVQSAASENASRMEAMRAATDNAAEMERALSLKLNLARQTSVTTELTEISAATLLRTNRKE